jgi:transposase
MSGYDDLINDAVRVKNRYKSLFRKAGEKVIREKIYTDKSFLEGLERPDFKFVGTQMYKQLEMLDETRKEYIKQIKISSRSFKEIKYLMTIPGIGIIQSAKIVAQVVNPYRFKNKYKFYSYCGLARHKRISDGVEYGSEKIWGNRILKCVFKMAGHSALKGSNGLKKYYEYLMTKGVSEKNASNAICRKISAIALSLWKKRQTYKDNILNNQFTQ